MSNINAPKIDYFKSFADEISSKFRRLHSIIGHPTTSGDYHEEVMRVVLRNFLSKRFSVKKGFIFKNYDEVSKQIDIMIIDENSPAAYIFQEGDFAIVIPQAVVAVIEVKTTLNYPDFGKALENIASAKSLSKFSSDITGIIFGFDGTSPTDEILDAWFKRPELLKFQSQETFTPDAIMFFTANSLLVRCDEDVKIGPNGKYYHRLSGIDENDWEIDGIAFQMSVMLAMIINSCEKKENVITHEFTARTPHLLQADRGGLSLTRFSFGDGKTTKSI